jgi:hypothetical protein
MRSVIIRGKDHVLLFPRDTQIRRGGSVQRRERLGGLLHYYPRNLAEKSRMFLWLEADCTCARPTMLLANARCHRTLLARSTGRATKGWATINALQFFESEPWINILPIPLGKVYDVLRHDDVPPEC